MVNSKWRISGERRCAIFYCVFFGFKLCKICRVCTYGQLNIFMITNSKKKYSINSGMSKQSSPLLSELLLFWVLSIFLIDNFFRAVLDSQQYWVESTESSHIFSFPVLLIFTLRLLHTFSMNSWSLGSRLGLRLDDLFTQLAKPWQKSTRKVLLANIVCLWSNKKNRQYG